MSFKIVYLLIAGNKIKAVLLIINIFKNFLKQKEPMKEKSIILRRYVKFAEPKNRLKPIINNV